MTTVRLLASLLLVFVVGGLLSVVPPAKAGHSGSVPGDLMVARLSAADAAVEWYHPDGSPNRRLEVGQARPAGGMAFDATGNLYVTDYGNGRVITYDRAGNPAGTLAGGLFKPYSIVFDSAGNAYVGQQGDTDVVKLDPQGRPVATIDLDVVEGGETGRIDLAPDQCTLFYRSGRSIRRYDACQGRELGAFAALSDEDNENNGAVRVVPSGGVLVADQTEIVRLSASGAAVQDYDADGEDKWYHLTLDPTDGGKSFWAAGGQTRKVYRFNLGTGEVERELAISHVSGLAVQGTAAPPPEPPIAQVLGVEVTERDTDSVPAVFTVTLDRVSTQPVSVNYATEDGSAKAGEDYKATSGTLQFPAEITSLTIVVEVIGDETVEPVEEFALVLSSPQGAVLAAARAVATIINDDQPPVQDPNSTSDAADSGGPGTSQVERAPAQPPAQSQPPAPAPAPLVAPVAAPAAAPLAAPAGVPAAAPVVQAQVAPHLQVGMMMERQRELQLQLAHVHPGREGFLASSRVPAAPGWPFVVGSAAVMLFGAGFACRRQVERAQATPAPAWVRLDRPERER